MGKEKPGFLTPKAIANRIKSKGMQKLRWYCQMCQKQCRDENGFKCHAMSESHQRQLLIFAENSKKFLDEFSSEFNREYLNTLKRRFGTKRVHANVVYQEYISDRNHIHMNSTQWLTLTDYVKWLGRKGICVVDETEKGWFVTWIDRDPETLRRQAEVEKKRKLDLDDTQRQQMYLEKQIERAKQAENKPAEQPTELKKAENEVIKISFKKTVNRLVTSDQPKTSKSDENSQEAADNEDDVGDEEIDEDEEYEDDGEEEEENSHDNSDSNSQEMAAASEETVSEVKKEPEEPKDELKEVKKEPKIKDEIKSVKKEPIDSQSPSIKKEKEEKATPSSSKSTTPSVSASVKAVFKVPAPVEKSKSEKRKQSALDEIIQEEERRKEAKNRKDYWLHKDIVVKITTSKLGEKYYKKKAVVTEVIDKYTGVVRLLDTDTVIKIDQAHLETVLPAIGKEVIVVNGAYRGEIAILEDINQDKFCAKISIAAGPLKGRVVNGVQYEDISKLNQ